MAIFPVSGYTLNTANITSRFGSRSAPTAGASTNHLGLDISAKGGTPVLSAAAGQVIKSLYNSAKGNYVQVRHLDGTVTEYEHLGSSGVNVGDYVLAGQQLGTVGSSGISTGNHLHFGVMQNGKYVNPESWLKGATSAEGGGSMNGNAIIDLLNKYFWYLLAGLLVFAVITKKR